MVVEVLQLPASREGLEELVPQRRSCRGCEACARGRGHSSSSASFQMKTRRHEEGFGLFDHIVLGKPDPDLVLACGRGSSLPLRGEVPCLRGCAQWGGGRPGRRDAGGHGSRWALAPRDDDEGHHRPGFPAGHQPELFGCRPRSERSAVPFLCLRCPGPGPAPTAGAPAQHTAATSLPHCLANSHPGLRTPAFL
uniref:Pseudouridine 5'-phosphatase n=1 Tax=Molossus molossus TaxID=27622 RepID=A0A7J8EFS9_MOLMO|nr:pseudouridine 5'-phosphatase [Molossus molossus]